MRLRLGLAQWRVEREAGVAGWAERLDRELAAAAAKKADLAVLPEYALLGAATGDRPDLAAELLCATRMVPEALDAARHAARRHRLWLLPGSMPVAEGGRVLNRAPLIAPDGSVAWQDKHVLTRFESEQWGISPGAPPNVFETPWGRIGIAICFDAEFPTLVRAQVEAGAWLILVPTCTDTMHGFGRVRIAAAPGPWRTNVLWPSPPPWATRPSARHSTQIAVTPPCSVRWTRTFLTDGVLAQGALDQPGWVFADLDPPVSVRFALDGAVRNHALWPAVPPASTPALRSDEFRTHHALRDEAQHTHAE